MVAYRYVKDTQGIVWPLTAHAAMQVAVRSISADTVVEVIEDPELDLPSDDRRHRPGLRIRTRRGVSLVYDPRSRLIITVMHRVAA